MSYSITVPNKAQSLNTNLIQGTVIGVFLTALSYALGLEAGWIHSLNWIEVFAVFTSYLCTFLCVVEKRINYPIGAVSNLAYCVLFAQSGLVGSSFVTGYLTFSLLYGWFRWKNDDNARPVTFMDYRWLPAYIALAGVSLWGSLYLYPLFHQPVVWTDAVILVGSVIAQLMLDNKKIENWIVWAVVNVFAIYTYFHAGLALAGFQYIFFLLNCFYGYWAWNKSRKETKLGDNYRDKMSREWDLSAKDEDAIYNLLFGDAL